MFCHDARIRRTSQISISSNRTAQGNPSRDRQGAQERTRCSKDPESRHLQMRRMATLRCGTNLSQTCAHNSQVAGPSPAPRSLKSLKASHLRLAVFVPRGGRIDWVAHVLPSGRGFSIRLRSRMHASIQETIPGRNVRSSRIRLLPKRRIANPPRKERGGPPVLERPCYAAPLRKPRQTDPAGVKARSHG